MKSKYLKMKKKNPKMKCKYLKSSIWSYNIHNQHIHHLKNQKKIRTN